jgi:hypothetical protein
MLSICVSQGRKLAYRCLRSRGKLTPCSEENRRLFCQLIGFSVQLGVILNFLRDDLQLIIIFWTFESHLIVKGDSHLIKNKRLSSWVDYLELYRVVSVLKPNVKMPYLTENAL